MKNMLKDAAILFIITIIAGCLLGLVFEVTKAPIEEQKIKAKNEACKEVFQEAAEFEEVLIDEKSGVSDEILAELGYPGISIHDVLIAKDDAGKALGMVLNVVSHEGYSGDIGFYMGIALDKTLNGISILSISETPGLGMKAETVLKPQFENKKADQYTSTKSGAAAEGEIDAISGATITTNAVTNGVNAGLSYFTKEYKNIVKGGGNNE